MRGLQLIAACALGVMLTTVGCSSDDAERRAREAAEKIKESMPDVEAKALAQKTSPEDVKLAQEALTVAHEYMGEINGTLDAVTVNSIEAFQRSRGIKGDGMLNDKTMGLLKATLAKK